MGRSAIHLPTSSLILHILTLFPTPGICSIPEDTALSKQERALVCKEVTDSKKVHVKQETISFQCSKVFTGNLGAHSKDTTFTLGLQLRLALHNASKRIMGRVQVCT